MKGEGLKLLGRPVDALAAYEGAMKLNPAIGVVKQLAVLEKGDAVINEPYVSPFNEDGVSISKHR